jgi:SAM-dependent methyltransferase
MNVDVAKATKAAIPAGRPRLFEFDATDNSRYTHYLFRYPAKFHPPVARGLLMEFTNEGDRVLDPFCGSGTLLVEAALAGRHGVGHDVDPLAVFVSSVKTVPLDREALERTLDRILAANDRVERWPVEYKRRKFQDLSNASFAEQTYRLGVPAIPNLEHWFRRYVIVDLARLRRAIGSVKATASHRAFFELCFASIIRAASNADPVPVSGLEVTKHMLDRDKEGRLVNPFELFETAANRAVEDMAAFAEAIDPDSTIRVSRQDATRLRRPVKPYDAVVTSPPYHGAVDYYRRHQLEMFWLRLTESQNERLDLLDQYIGRPWPPARHPFVTQETLAKGSTTASVERRIRRAHPRRADAFKHYAVAMTKVFERLSHALKPGSPAILVVGHSSWNGDNLNTSKLFAELAAPYFRLKDRASYPVKNRYMSYSRHNDASIDREYVLVLERTRSG